MSTLQIIGIVVVAVLPVAGFFGWKLHQKNKAAERMTLNFDKALTVLPQLELNLQPSSIKAWLEESRLKTDEITLREAGLVHIGYFVNRSSLRKLQVSLWQFKSSLTVALCENQLESDNFDDETRTEYSCQAIARLNNGSTLCVTSSDTALQLTAAAPNPVIFSDDSNPVNIMRSLKAHLPSDAKLVPIRDSKALFTAHYESHSHWLWQSEQIRGEAVRELLDLHAVEVGDELMQQLEEHGQTFLSQIYSHKVLERLGQTPTMNADHWQSIRGKCLVIHEKMSAEHLSNALFQALPDLTSEQEKELESLGEGGPIHDPITSFHDYLNSFNTSGSTKRIAQMQQPVRAVVYLPE